MANKITPYPWKLVSIRDDEGQTIAHGIYGSNGDLVLTMNTPEYLHWQEIEANMKLMTVAPELLEALSGLVSDMESEQESGVEEGIYEDEEREDIKTLKALILKATP